MVRLRELREREQVLKKKCEELERQLKAAEKGNQKLLAKEREDYAEIARMGESVKKITAKNRELYKTPSAVIYGFVFIRRRFLDFYPFRIWSESGSHPSHGHEHISSVPSAKNPQYKQ